MVALRVAALVALLTSTASTAPPEHFNPQMFQLHGPNVTVSDQQNEKGVCMRDRDYLCNRHNPAFLCTCYQANPTMPMKYISCDEKFKVMNVKAYVLTLRSHLPIYERFFELIDELFSKIVADFCAIPSDYLVILRKRCTRDYMYVMFGFLTNPNVTGTVTSEHMQPIYPNIFLNNLNFMYQQYLPILNISQIELLPYIVRKVHPPSTMTTLRPHKFSEEILNEKPVSNFVILGAVIFAIFVILIACMRNVCTRE